MTVKQVVQALGDWSLRLRADTPRDLLDQLDYLGHVAILPGRLDDTQLGDQLLAVARYVGVYRGRGADDEYSIQGAGMAFWLGDEDDKGDIFEAGVTLTAQTFANSVTALLPASGAVTVGTLHSQPGTYTGTHRWETPRKAIARVVELFDAEYRVNGDGTLDAGTVAQLYRTTPVVLLVRSDQGGRELARVALPGRMGLDSDVEDWSSRVVVLAEGEGDAIATGSADALTVPYRDIHGNDAVMTRLVSSAETPAANASALAQLQLNRFTNPRQAVRLSASAYDVSGDLAVGDYLAVYDTDNGFYDLNNEQYWQGRAINPIYLRCIELAWPVPAGWTVAFRRATGVWVNLSDWYIPEGSDTEITVGEFSRSLTAIGTQPVGTRPNGDNSVPAAPAFTGFSVGTYQSASDATMTQAAIRAQWSTPLNIDGSTVLDGDHYEIRYRVNAVIGYQISHDQMELFTHDDFGTHDAMLSEPVEASPQWQTAIVGWGTNEFTIIELTPGVQYELQIRAVDGAVPPNQGPWSASSFVNTLGDLIAPSIPAAPAVAASRIAIQVLHQLGKASGGTFNLEPDLDHLDVHVGGSASFTPSEANRVGRLIATGGMVFGAIPAVGTFSVEPIDQVHVKVVAVDRSGNRSGASESATATADLIDNAHISDLTVSKVTAGTISATWVNAGRITTGLSGRRIELESDRLAVYGANGARLIDLVGELRRLSFYEPVGPPEDDLFSNPVLEMGRTSTGNIGMRVADLFGDTKVHIGQIDPLGGFGSSNYGIALENDSGELTKMEDFVFGPQKNQVNNAEATTSLSYTDLGTFGPEVTVEVGQTGRVMVILTARIGWTVTGAIGGGKMGVELSGANTRAAGTSDGAQLSKYQDVAGAAAQAAFDRSSSIYFYDDLTPGSTTFTCKYASLVSAKNADFEDRVIAVFPY